MIWSTLSFRAEKISLASRIWRPRWAILRLTIPYSSWPASGSPTASAAAGGDAVQAAVDLLQWTQRNVRESGRQQQRKKNCDAGKNHRLLQPGRQFVLQKNRRYAHSDAAEASPVKLQRDAHVVHGGRVVHHAKLPAKVRVLHQVEVGPVGNCFAHQVGIGVQNGLAVAIDDGRVVNDGPGPHHRFQKIIEIAVGAQVIGHRPPHGLGIGGVDLGAAQIGGGVRRQVRQVGSQLSCRFCAVVTRWRSNSEM